MVIEWGGGACLEGTADAAGVVLATPPPCGRTRAGGSEGLAISQSPSGTIHPHRPLPMARPTTN
ncbi:hypothetical protein GCM10010211_77860 [Streptomyces albospinus]|uniref:Uncharacterized protein n=1 Tax=Streptomyces albospinus TaxID=285515 RepID=A0ABQ2VMB2_9ACTN|nr:hypothetical protein GCM10010211_77860 [Streptomyces albospinus]